MKNLFFALTCLTLLIPPSSITANICGDVNSDAGVNVGDVVYLVNLIFHQGPLPKSTLSADVNSDGGVNIGDAVCLTNHVFNEGTAPACFLYDLPAATVIIPQIEAAAILGYDTITGVITLDESSPYAQQIAVDGILIGQNDTEAPFGFMRKVVSKTSLGGTVALETGPATLIEAFEAMDITETHQLRPADIISYELYQGAEFVFSKSDDTFLVELDCVLYDLDTDPGTTDDQIKLGGQYSFTAALFTEIVVSYLTLQKFEAGIEIDENADIDLTADVYGQFPEATEFDLAEIHFGAIPAGGVVWLVPTLTVKAHIDGDLTVTFQTGISYTQQLRYGFGYDDEQYYDISESAEDFSYTPPDISEVFNFESGISLSASCLLYGAAGPYMGGKTGFQYESAMNADPCNAALDFSLDAGTYNIAGIGCNMLGLDYISEFQLYAHPVGSWVYPLTASNTLIIDPVPDSISAPWSLSGPCGFVDSGTGNDTLLNLDAGLYEIVWEPVSGWLSAITKSITLVEDDTAAIIGLYMEVDTISDVDGNIYQVVKIGDQWWMAENLKVTHYCNGDPIPNVTGDAAWNAQTTGAYCNYDNDVSNVSTYGRLYNWRAATDPSNIAPVGWHVPSDAEWQTLVDYLGGASVAGGKLKEAGTTHWISPNTGATNESRFFARPGGYRYHYGRFETIGEDANFWSTTEGIFEYAWTRSLFCDSSRIYRNNYYIGSGFSIRCVKD